MKTALFVCIHNSARSQMAEAFVNAQCVGSLLAFSAGLERGTLNPTVVEAMRELGYDISRNRSKSVDDPEIRLRSFDYVVTVCDDAVADACPIVPTNGTRLHWPFPDPAQFRGDADAGLLRTRRVRDAIAAKVAAWCSDVCLAL